MCRTVIFIVFIAYKTSSIANNFFFFKDLFKVGGVEKNLKKSTWKMKHTFNFVCLFFFFFCKMLV